MFAITNTLFICLASVAFTSVLVMLHGNICLAVIPSQGLGNREKHLVDLALACEYVDAVAISTQGAVENSFFGASVRNRKRGSSMVEIVEDLLGEDNQDFMVNPELPITLVYLTDPVDLQAATEVFEQRESHALVSVHDVNHSEHILNRANLILPANPHALEALPLRYVEPDGKLVIANYQELLQHRGIDLVRAIGFLQAS